MQAAGRHPEGPFLQFARALELRYRRRQLGQAAVDALRWCAAAYGGVLAGLAIFDGALALRTRGVLAAAGAVAWAGLAVSLYRRRVGGPADAVGRLEAALPSDQLATTAWELAHGRIASPFGPAVLEAADRLALAAWPRLSSLAGRVVRRRRTLLAVGVALGLSLPGVLRDLHRAADDVRTALAPPAAPQSSFPALSPDQARFLERLARLLEKEAAATADPGAERAARELNSVLAMSSGAAASRPALEPGPAGSGSPRAPGGAQRTAGAGFGAAQAPLSPQADLEGHLELLLRLAQLGLIARDTADRGAELAALLTDALPAPDESGKPAPGTGLQGSTGTFPERFPEGPGADTASQGRGARRPPAQENPPARGSPAEGGQDTGQQPAPGGPAARVMPGEGLRVDREAVAGAQTQQDATGPAGAEGVDREGNAASGRLRDVPPSPGPPGTAPGVLEAGEPAAVEGAGQRIPLPSAPQLGRGAVLTVLPGPSVPPVPGEAVGPWRPDVRAQQGGSEGSPADIETVPLEYREAVRRYFEALAGGGG